MPKESHVKTINDISELYEFKCLRSPVHRVQRAEMILDFFAEKLNAPVRIQWATPSGVAHFLRLLAAASEPVGFVAAEVS